MAPLFIHHFLLWCVREISGCICARPQTLDRLHHVGFLRIEGLAHRCGPLDVFIQPLQKVRVVGERFDAVVPWLVANLFWIQAGFGAARRQNNVERDRRSRQDQGHERIGKKRDRPHEFVQLARRPSGADSCAADCGAAGGGAAGSCAYNPQAPTQRSAIKSHVFIIQR